MPKPKLRVFLDSNVIVSGLYSPQGAPDMILECFTKGDFSVVVSQQVLEETIRAIKAKLPVTLSALRRLLLNMPPEVVADPKVEDIERWSKKLSLADAAVMSSAAASQPDYFITGDNHFLENPALAEKTGLHIITPVQFLKLIQSL